MSLRRLVILLFAPLALARAEVPVDLSGLATQGEVRCNHEAVSEVVTFTWPIAPHPAAGTAALTLNLDSRKPLIAALRAPHAATGQTALIAENLAPLTVLTVGERDLSRNGWMVFFDKVHTRPSQRYPARLNLTSVRATSTATRARIALEGLTAGPFSGRYEITIFSGSPLVLIEAVLSTALDRRAILYDAGLVAPAGKANRYLWIDPRDGSHAEPADTPGSVRATRYRTAVLELPGGLVTVFPPAHRYLYPLDFADNFGFNWVGRHYEPTVAGDGIGIRQPPAGDNRYVPWVNAPPGTEQRLPLFFRFGTVNAAAEFSAVARYTHEDRFAPLAGYKTFTSHYHVEHTLDLLQRRQAAGSDTLPPELRHPGFVRAFRDAGVDIVHLAEFHNGRTPKLAMEERLRQLRVLHAECARLSDDKFLLLPGEEPNVYLGGHWISFFPKPVLWVLNRPPGTAFASTTPAGETVYHVGSAADVLELMQRESGLMWAAHARIKSTIGFPDNYRDSAFFRSPHYLGAAWKAMPADYSRDTLGWRVLDLLDDMNNWGADKRMLGEVDVFKVEPHYELYGHLNVNYLKLEQTPRFSDGWAPLLEVLRRGEFFVTTGEVLASGFALSTEGPPAVQATLTWTLPLAFAEVVAGDGTRVVRQRVELGDTRAFGRLDLRAPLPTAPGLRWARLAVWDVAGNGAFTQPVSLATKVR